MISLMLLNFAGSSATSLVVEGETDFDPEPYDTRLKRMIIAKAEGPVKVSLFNAGQLLAEGSGDNLSKLASFFDFPLNSQRGHHAHYEYYEGNEWIAADSVPLVICVS